MTVQELLRLLEKYEADDVVVLQGEDDMLIRVFTVSLCKAVEYNGLLFSIKGQDNDDGLKEVMTVVIG